MGQRSSTEQPTTIRYMGHSSGRGPTVTSRKRYSTGPDQTNSSDYRKIGYGTDNVPDKNGHRRSLNRLIAQADLMVKVSEYP